MLGTFVDIHNELQDVEQEAAMLAESIERFRSAPGEDQVWRWLAVQGLASAVEKIYTGCERVMMRIASDIDGARIDGGDGWHVALLKRMARPFPGIREEVISDELFRALDKLRAFRHRQRYSYGSTLDQEIVLQRAVETGAALKRFRLEIDGFARHFGDGAET